MPEYARAANIRPATDGTTTTHDTRLPGMTSPPVTNRCSTGLVARSRHTLPVPI